jgi:hypothetical protein
LQQEPHGRFFNVHAIGNELGADFGGSEHGADDAAIAVGERAHGVVDMNGMPHAAGNCRAGLLVSGVGVAHGNHDAGIVGGIDARRCAEQLRSNGQDARIPGSGLQQTVEKVGGGQLEPLRGMHTATSVAKEWPLVVNSEDFGARSLCVELSGDETSDPLHAAAGVIGTCRYGGSDKGSSSVARERAGHYGHRFLGAFHDVVTASAVDVHIDKSGNGGAVHCRDFLRTRGQAHALAWTNGLNDAVSNKNSGTEYFCCGS